MSLISDSKRYWPLLMANALYYLFTGMSESVIAKHVYELLSPRLISLQTVIGWGGALPWALPGPALARKCFPC